eukprot:gene13155-biopygen3568
MLAGGFVKKRLPCMSPMKHLTPDARWTSQANRCDRTALSRCPIAYSEATSSVQATDVSPAWKHQEFSAPWMRGFSPSRCFLDSSAAHFPSPAFRYGDLISEEKAFRPGIDWGRSLFAVWVMGFGAKLAPMVKSYWNRMKLDDNEQARSLEPSIGICSKLGSDASLIFL